MYIYIYIWICVYVCISCCTITYEICAHFLTWENRKCKKTHEPSAFIYFNDRLTIAYYFLLTDKSVHCFDSFATVCPRRNEIEIVIVQLSKYLYILMYACIPQKRWSRSLNFNIQEPYTLNFMQMLSYLSKIRISKYSNRRFREIERDRVGKYLNKIRKRSIMT